MVLVVSGCLHGQQKPVVTDRPEEQNGTRDIGSEKERNGSKISISTGNLLKYRVSDRTGNGTGHMKLFVTRTSGESVEGVVVFRDVRKGFLVFRDNLSVMTTDKNVFTRQNYTQGTYDYDPGGEVMNLALPLSMIAGPETGFRVETVMDTGVSMNVSIQGRNFEIDRSGKGYFSGFTAFNVTSSYGGRTMKFVVGTENPYPAVYLERGSMEIRLSSVKVRPYGR